jgi:hypothetical protein
MELSQPPLVTLGDLLFGSVRNDCDLVRRSWHSIQRERWDRRLFLDNARSENQDLERADGETRNFVLWWLSGRGFCDSEREDC